jgi:hypothetical protein
LIAGSFDYSEYSFVNNPADRRSGIVELLNSEGEVVQSFSQEDSSNIPEISFVVSDSTIKEDKQMDLEQVKEILKDHKRYQSIQNLDELISTALKDKDFTVERLFVLLEGAVDADLKNLTIKTAEAEGHKHFAYLDEDGDGSTDWVHIGDDDGHTHLVMGFKVSPRGKNQHIHNLANPLKKISNSEDAVKDFFGDGYEELVGDDVSGHLYAEMLFSLLEDTEDRDITEQLIHDAKLSSKQRKKLPGSTFCGPERSFPVNDCAHYTAALRLIGRYKGPGDKGRIRACIERKGKRLGCTSKKKDSVNVGDFSLGYFDEFSDEELLQMANGVQLTLEERKLSNKPESQQNDAVDRLSGDLLAAQDALVKANANIRKQKIEKVALLSFLVGDNKDLDAMREEVKDKSSEELDSLIASREERFDIKSFADMIFSGITRNPEGQVDNPTLQTDQTREFDPEKIKKIEDKFKEIANASGFEFANSWLQKKQQEGLYPTAENVTGE